jgi:hypothetical protein
MQKSLTAGNGSQCTVAFFWLRIIRVVGKGAAMTLTKNQFGVPQYPESDARRLFVLLAAIDLLERPTTSAIADLTSLPRDAIEIGIRVLEQQYGVQLIRAGEVFRIESWGDVLRRDGVMRHLRA